MENNNIIGEKYSFYSETTCQKLNKIDFKIKREWRLINTSTIWLWRSWEKNAKISKIEHIFFKIRQQNSFSSFSELKIIIVYISVRYKIYLSYLLDVS